MIRKVPPRFTPGMSPQLRDSLLNQAMVDLYTYLGGFTAAPPLQIFQDAAGLRLSIDIPRLADIKVTSSSLSTITLPGGRTITDGVLNNTTTLSSSSQANFTSADVGKELVATGIPAGTTIASVTNSTTAIMSAAATTGASGVTVTIGGIQGYAAKVESWSNTFGTWSDSSYSVWFIGINSETPTNGTRYCNCELLGQDTGGQQIWGTSIASSSGGSGIEVLDKAGTVIDATCTKLQMDTDGVITVTHVGTGQDQLAATDASATQRGVVNTTTQTFAGDKTFEGEVFCQSGLDITDGLTTSSECLWTATSTTSVISYRDHLGTNIGNITMNTNGVLDFNFPVAFAKTDLAQGVGSTATTATTGFLILSTCAGAPTGTPASAGLGYGALIYDTTNHKLWFYDPSASAWKGVVLT